MNTPFLPYGRHEITDDDIDAVTAILRSGWLTQGPAVAAFEKRLQALTGAPYCIATCNGTAALYLGCRSIGLGQGDIGLCPSLTFSATANAIAACGARPVFVDIDGESLTISLEDLERKLALHPESKLLAPVDLGGIPANLPAIAALRSQYPQLRIMEDSAHSLGSVYHDNEQSWQCGSCNHTDLAIFSFHPVKTITCGEGGAVLTRDENLARRIRRLAEHGIERQTERFVHFSPPQPYQYEVQELSLNFRMSDIHAALGISQLRRLELYKKRRKKLVDEYRLRLQPMVEAGHFSFVKPAIPCEPCYHLLQIIMRDCPEGLRDLLYHHLKEHGIGSQVHYIPVHLHPYYHKQLSRREELPVTERIAKRLLSLPLFPAMSMDDVERVCSCIETFFRNH